MRSRVTLLSTLALLLVSLTLFISCSKKSSNSNSTPTMSSLAGSYLITDLKVTPSGQNQQIDVYNQFTDCDKRTKYNFTAAGIYSVSGVVTQSCSSSDDSGTWSLSNNTVTINSDSNGTETFNITSWNGKTLVLTFTGNFGGVDGTFIFTFIKQ